VLRYAVIPAALLAACLSLAACGETKTIVIREQASPTEASDSSPASQDSAGEPNSIVSDDGSGGDIGGGKITVPNEVGKNHQAAQDDLQAHGLFNLSEEDATGQGRMLILDRNWVVVSQSPKPGARVNEDATITLRSKKYTD
jgi:hypothetical protein